MANEYDDFDWSDWDNQAAEYLATSPDFADYNWSSDTSFGPYLSSSDYKDLTGFKNWFPEAEYLPSNDITAVDLTGGDFDWSDWDKQAAEYLASDAAPVDYSSAGGSGLGTRPLVNSTGLKGGIQYTPGQGITLGSDTGPQPIYYASGEKGGLAAPTDDMQGIRLYSGNEAGNYSGVGEREQFKDFDILAMTPEGRAMLRDAGVSPEVLNYYESWANADPTRTPYLGTTSTTYSDKGSLSQNVAKSAEKLAEIMAKSAIASQGQGQKGTQGQLGSSATKSLAEREAEARIKLIEKQIADMESRKVKQEDPLSKALSGLGMAAAMAQALEAKSGSAARRPSGAINVGGPKFSGSAPQKKANGGVIRAEIVSDKADIPMLKGGLGSIMSRIMQELVAKQNGHKGLIRGSAGGQDDVVDVKAAPGEYVFDAETVSALGDGNTNAGAKKLDQMRQSIRKHKRSGALSQIAPKAKSTKAYLGS